MPRATRIALFLMGGPGCSTPRNALDAFKSWLSGGVQDLGESVVKELLLNWLNPFLTVEIPKLALHNNKALAAALHAATPASRCSSGSSESLRQADISHPRTWMTHALRLRDSNQRQKAGGQEIWLHKC